MTYCPATLQVRFEPVPGIRTEAHRQTAGWRPDGPAARFMPAISALRVSDAPSLTRSPARGAVWRWAGTFGAIRPGPWN